MRIGNSGSDPSAEAVIGGSMMRKARFFSQKASAVPITSALVTPGITIRLKIGTLSSAGWSARAAVKSEAWKICVPAGSEAVKVFTVVLVGNGAGGEATVA